MNFLHSCGKVSRLNTKDFFIFLGCVAIRYKFCRLDKQIVFSARRVFKIFSGVVFLYKPQYFNNKEKKCEKFC